MRILFVGDIHFRAFRLSEQAEAWAKVVEWSKANGVDWILQAGDVFERPNVFGKEADLGTIYGAFLEPFRGVDRLKVMAIPGNHDMGGPRDLDALTPLDTHSWINVRHGVGGCNIGENIHVVTIPWVNKASLIARHMDAGVTVKQANEAASNALGSMMKNLKNGIEVEKSVGKTVIVLGHMEITGAVGANGRAQANGLFEFTPKELSSLGADVYGLGHIHSRQYIAGLPNKNDGYLGTLCQLNYGERNNAVGVRLVDIEHGKITEDRFIDNKSSPRYFVVDSLEGAKWRSFDHVRLKGKTRPESLPPGIEFEKIPDEVSTTRRVEEDIDSSTSISTLLEIWRTQNGSDISLPDMIASANKLLAKATLPSDSIGSIEKVERILLRNITSHVDTTIDLTEVNGAIAVMGPNGAGKTTAIEAILIALYGQSPNHMDLQELIRQNATEALIEVDFVSSGSTYTARREFRKTPKTFTHRAYIHKKGDKEPFAGPKIEDVYSRSCQLVGDPDMVLAGIFSCQASNLRENMGDIVEMEPRDRKELFAKLLGTDKFLVLGEMASDITKADNAMLEIYRARIERLRAEVALQDSNPQTVLDLRETIKKLGETLTELEQSVATREAIVSGLTNRKEQATKLRDKMQAIRTEGHALKAKFEAVKKVDIEALEAEIKVLREKEAAFNKLKAEADALSTQAAEQLSESFEIKTKASQLREKRSAAFALETTKATKRVSEFENSRSRMRLELEKEFGKLETRKAAVVQKIATAQKGAELVANIPDVDACKRCPLAKSGLDSREELKELATAMERAEEATQKASAHLAAFDEETQRLLAEKTTQTPIKDTFMPELEKEAIQLLEKAVGVEFKSATIKTAANAKLAESNALKVPHGTIPTHEARLALARGAKDEIATMEAQLASLRTQFTQAEEEARNIDPSEQETTEANAALDEQKTRVRDLKTQIDTNNVELGRMQSKLEELDGKKKEMEELEDTWRTTSQRIEVYNALAKAFGRDGIPQLIVDSAMPHFRDVMFKLMGVFDGQWTIDVQTQLETKKKTLKEEIHIIADAGMGPRDIRTFSGGEKKILKAILRIAFAQLQAERTGKGMKIMVLDELIDAMDESKKEAFVRMMPHLGDKFNQIFVVSHDAAVLSCLPSKLVFSKPGLSEPSSVEFYR